MIKKTNRWPRKQRKTAIKIQQELEWKCASPKGMRKTADIKWKRYGFKKLLKKSLKKFKKTWNEWSSGQNKNTTAGKECGPNEIIKCGCLKAENVK